MESARVVFLNLKKNYGIAEVIIFKNNGKEIIGKSKDIIFHLGCGYKMRPGKIKPKFNYKAGIKKIPQPGEYIVFVRKKVEDENLRDKAVVWGLRSQYKEMWRKIDKQKRKQKKLVRINRLFHEIETERSNDFKFKENAYG